MRARAGRAQTFAARARGATAAARRAPTASPASRAATATPTAGASCAPSGPSARTGGSRARGSRSGATAIASTALMPSRFRVDCGSRTPVTPSDLAPTRCTYCARCSTEFLNTQYASIYRARHKVAPAGAAGGRELHHSCQRAPMLLSYSVVSASSEDAGHPAREVRASAARGSRRAPTLPRTPPHRHRTERSLTSAMPAVCARAPQLQNFHSHSRGWQSAHFCEFPQQLVLKFDARITLQQVQLLSHQFKIAQRVELYMGSTTADAYAACEPNARPPRPGGALLPPFSPQPARLRPRA